jgi:hypothetical protein
MIFKVTLYRLIGNPVNHASHIEQVMSKKACFDKQTRIIGL